jgi:hypothetical protein
MNCSVRNETTDHTIPHHNPTAWRAVLGKPFVAQILKTFPYLSYDPKVNGKAIPVTGREGP